jgi:hypothetical protein
VFEHEAARGMCLDVIRVVQNDDGARGDNPQTIQMASGDLGILQLTDLGSWWFEWR